MDMTYPIRPRRGEMRRMKMCMDWSGGAVQSSQGFWLSPLIFVPDLMDLNLTDASCGQQLGHEAEYSE